MAVDTAEAILVSRSASFFWQLLANDNPPQSRDFQLH
jgi:hypothetical protein